MTIDKRCDRLCEAGHADFAKRKAGGAKGTAMKKGTLALLVHGRTENWSPQRWKSRFDDVCKERRVLLLPDASFDPAEVHYAAVWKPHPGELAGFPNLRVIFNLGAGVDALMVDRSLPDVPLVRVAVGDLTARMTEYVVLHVLMHHRQELYLRGVPARKTLGAEIAMGGRCDLGRHHGAGHARRRCSRRAQTAGLSRRGLEPEPESHRRHRLLSWRGADRTVPAADRHPGLPAAADTGDAARSQSRRCLRNSIATARSARRF